MDQVIKKQAVPEQGGKELFSAFWRKLRRGLFNPSVCPALLPVLLGVALLSGCAGGEDGLQTEAKYPSGYDRTTTGDDVYGEKQSIFGKDGLTLFGGKDKKSSDDGAALGINSYLWRAALDTVSFMPLASADPFGGVILTDWYASPEQPGERFKLNVFILSKDLRSDGVRVKAFRQVRSAAGSNEWQDAAVAPETGPQLEEAVLTRARQLRVARLAEDE